MLSIRAMRTPSVATLFSCVALLCLRAAVAQISADELTFAKIAAQNATKQWTLSLATGNLASPDFTPVTCKNEVVGACGQTPLMQDTGDLLRVTYQLNNTRGAIPGSLKTYNGGVPTKVELRACYTLTSSTDRAWRKKNKPYPRLSQNCPRKFYTGPFNGSATPVDIAANSGTQYMNFNKFDEIPTATWFVMMWVYCGDSVCAFETTEGTSVFETKVEMGVTTGMKIAAIVLSIFGPAFFFIFYGLDTVYYKKHGKPLLLF